MTAPTPVTRGTPNGIKMGDGYQSLIAPSADTDIEFFEKSVTPSSLDGGDPVDTTTMHNTTYRSKSPRQLQDVGDLTSRVAYDPVVYQSCIDLINVETTWTVTFPNGDKITFYGFLRSFTPGELVEGSQPEADIVVVVTNSDPSSGVEEGPVVTATAGTGTA